MKNGHCILSYAYSDQLSTSWRRRRWRSIWWGRWWHWHLRHRREPPGQLLRGWRWSPKRLRGNHSNWRWRRPWKCLRRGRHALGRWPELLKGGRWVCLRRLLRLPLPRRWWSRHLHGREDAADLWRWWSECHWWWRNRSIGKRTWRKWSTQSAIGTRSTGKRRRPTCKQGVGPAFLGTWIAGSQNSFYILAHESISNAL